MKKKIYVLIYLVIQLIRISSIIFFLIQPFFTWVVVTFLDYIDYHFNLRSGMKYSKYQKIDKSLDFLNQFYLLITALFFGWEHVYIFIIMFIIRSVGDLLYFKTENEKYFFYFPNLLEPFFALYYLFVVMPESYNVLTLILIILLSLVYKLIHEYIIHIKLWIDPISKSYMKENMLTERGVF